MLPRTLKARVETHTLLEIEDAPKNTSKQSFVKYLSPSPFLMLKKKFTSLNEQEFSLSNTAKKYFGRKTKHISNSSKVDSIRSYFRYFRKVDFGETDYWASIIVTIKSLGDIGVLDQPIQVNKACVQRIVAVCPCKVSIVSNDNLNSKWWLSRPMNFRSNIKDIKIALFKIDQPQLLKTAGLFKYFNNIESCCVCIMDDDESNQYESEKPEPLIIESLTALCRIETLKSLELDLSQTTIARETLTALLNEITMYEPIRWHLKVRLAHGRYDQEFPIEIEKLKTILNRLDFLGLKASCTYVSGEYCDTDVDGYEYNPTDELSNMEHLTRKRKRIIDMSFHDSCVRSLNLKPLLENCISLKGIYLRYMGSCFEINSDIGWCFAESKDEIKTWASNLEDVVFSINDNTGYGDHAHHFLLQALRYKSRNLKSLETFFCTSCDDYASDERRQERIYLGRKDNIENHVEGLESIASLQELKLASNGTGMNELEVVLKRLTNITKLHLVFGVGSKKQTPWDSDFPFKNCGNLQEFKITINPDMKSQPWGNWFIQRCSYLQNLSVLEIHDQAKPMSLRIFCSLVKKLINLKNIRRMIVETNVKSSAALEEIPVESQVEVWESLSRVIEGLKGQVRSYINSNTKLEELRLGKLEGFSFESIEYIGFEYNEIK